MSEQWQTIEEFPDYSVSNTGKIRNNKTGRILKPYILNGYKKIRIKNKQTYKISRLVAQAFIPNPNNYPIVNHKDENKLNDNVTNLEWCTHQYNTAYSVGKKVIQLDVNGSTIKEWDSVAHAAKEMGVPHYIILGCCENNTGYNWKFKESD
jgi:hypothetical protein